MNNRLRELRVRDRMSQEELAKRIGVSRQTIIRIESGESPSIETALFISKLFNESVNDIFTPKQ